MIPRSVLLLIPFTMYLVCRTNGCGREVWRQTERQWLEEEWTDLTDMELYPNALDKFLTFIYSQPEYGQLQNDMLRLRVTLAEELMKTNLERRTEVFIQFKSFYARMYKTLTRFVLQVPEMLKRNAPTVLINLKFITNILDPNDESFNIDYTHYILDRWQKIENATKLVLLKMGRYVAKENMKWFHNEKGMLEYWFVELSYRARFLKTETTTFDRTTGARAGIGSANRGTFDLVEIIELKKKMKSLQDLAPSP
ncbi:uncharacterized protein LOC129924594 isoform X1 [Biomphalaria glabrata]|uniref:Uncharacterized protein LOC129924594 isoform X1 n=1 Tax=Biomphalaria glabrata TaxID=6526 RepID=A0A9W2ZN93_BIOGL|nr:uncharacterized protein LOC129924594 isoform X1 [Biomphalaria glabrata]